MQFPIERMTAGVPAERIRTFRLTLGGGACQGGAALDTFTLVHNNTAMNAMLRPVATLINLATALGATG